MTQDELFSVADSFSEVCSKAKAEQLATEAAVPKESFYFGRPKLTPECRAGRAALLTLSEGLMLTALALEEGAERPPEAPAQDTRDAELLADLIRVTRGAFQGSLCFNDFILQANAALVRSGRTMSGGA